MVTYACVRASWYGAMARTLERFSARMPLQVGRKTAKALVAEPERSVGVASQRWATLLLLMKHAEVRLTDHHRMRALLFLLEEKKSSWML